MAWLNENPPARSQYRHPRRDAVSGVFAIHTAENTPDHVAFDGGAEAVARFIRDRDTPGSYHVLADSDSRIDLVELGDEAFHDGTGTNPHSIGLSIATRADVWPLAPDAWKVGAIGQLARGAAKAAAYVKAKRGIVVPARRITAEQARAKVPGFVTHAALDPTRRTDPGAGFPWPMFLAAYARLNPDLTEPEEDSMAPAPCSHWRDVDTGRVYRVAASATSRVWLKPAELKVDEALLRLGGFEPKVIDAKPPAKAGDFDFKAWLAGIPIVD